VRLRLCILDDCGECLGESEDLFIDWSGDVEAAIKSKFIGVYSDVADLIAVDIRKQITGSMISKVINMAKEMEIQ
jgi:hypothetical protein